MVFVWSLECGGLRGLRRSDLCRPNPVLDGGVFGTLCFNPYAVFGVNDENRTFFEIYDQNRTFAKEERKVLNLYPK